MKLSSDTLALGRALVDQLELDDRRDLLARWMANDIALKMAAARSPGATAQTQKDCADAIYALWAHRADVPMGQRPFEALEKVAQLLLDLDPSNPTSYYYRRTNESAGEGEKWLGTAEIFDRTARILIVHCLQQAAVERGLLASDWVSIAEAAGLEAPERLIVRILAYGADEGARDSELSQLADRLNGLLDILKSFRRVSLAVSADLRVQLAALGPVPPRPKVKNTKIPRSHA